MQSSQLKSFLVSGVISLFAMLLFFYMIGSFESGAGDAIIVALFSAVVFGAIYMYFKHYYRKMNSQTEEDKQKQKALEAEAEASAMREQVEQYENLKITKSYKGQTVLAIVIVIVFSLLFSSAENMKGVIYESLLYVLFAYFIYKGQRWAMYVVFILLTLDYLFKIAETGFTLSMVFYWGIIGIPLYRAIQVENQRKLKSLISRG